VRLGIALCGTLAFWLLSAPTVDAAPHARHSARVSRSLDERSVQRRVRARAATQRSGRHAAHYLLRAERLVRSHVAEWLERGQTFPLGDHDAATLQNTAAAVGGDDHLLGWSLTPLGLLSTNRTRLTPGGVVAPRAPRGPPGYLVDA